MRYPSPPLVTLLLAGTVGALTPKMQSLKDISVGVGEQLPTGFIGVGARAMGMGGAHIGGALDGTALYWNPAALTRVRRIELLGGLTHGRPYASADVGLPTLGSPVVTGASTAVTSLNTLVITAPYPTYRGGLTFALGVTRPEDYAYRARQDGVVVLSGTDYAQQDEVRQSGGLSQYAMGMGVEVSPTISLGGALIWYHGNVKVTRSLSLLDQVGTPPDSLIGTYRQSNSINGVSLTVGTSIALPLGFDLGALAVPPVTYEMEGKWGDEYAEAIGQNVFHYDYVEKKLHYKIESPWQLGVGLTWATYAVTLSTDLWYADWRQARFDGSPYGSSSGINAETFFEDRYRQKLRWHVGGEVLLPWISTYLRGGYYYDPDPFRGPVLDTGEAVAYARSGSYYTVGAGWLIEKTLTADVAFVYGGERFTVGNITEKRTTRRLFLTLGFRL